jgi:hypothetical protein
VPSNAKMQGIGVRVQGLAKALPRLFPWTLYTKP